MVVWGGDVVRGEQRSTTCGRRRAIWRALLSAAVLCAVVALGGGAAPAAAQTPAAGEVLVKFVPAAPESERREAHRNANTEVVRTIAPIDVEGVRVRPGTTVEQAIAAYRARPDVIYAERNGVMRAALIPNDPSYGSQWGLPKIQAPAAWDVTTGATGVTIAVLDTGVSSSHPEFTGRLLTGKNTLTNTAFTDDVFGHGTHVAGIATARGNNGTGVSGVSWLNQILPVKVLGDDGYGTDLSVADGIIYAADQGARVINLSLGGDPVGGACSQTLTSAVQYALARNVVIAAAAGNENSSVVICPARITGVLSVGSSTESDGKSSFSNFGSLVSLAAPGSNIYSTLPGGYGTLSGTSMATPFVSGAAALVLAANPGWTEAQVRNRLLTTTNPINFGGQTLGRLNAGAALGAAPPPPPPCSGRDCPPAGSFTLGVTKSGTGTGTVTSTSPVSPSINCGATCSASYSSGTVVSLSAAAGTGSVFAGWSGACSGTGACNVTMDAAKTVTATFNLSSPPSSFTLTVTKVGQGTVVSTAPPSPNINCGVTCSAAYPSGTVVTLAATPAGGYVFAGWSGACSGTATCNVAMNAAQTVNATFSAAVRQ
jgi:thermitase